MEMSLTDHQDAAASQPIPASQRADQIKKALPAPPDPTTEPLPEPTEKADPPSKKESGASASVAPVTSSATTEKDKSARTPGGAERLSRHDRASFTNEDGDDGEYKIKRMGKAPVEVPRRSIVGASLLWMLGLVIFFFVGRCAGYSRAARVRKTRRVRGSCSLKM